MTGTASWLVLFPRERAPSIDDAVARLGESTMWKVQNRDEHSAVISAHDPVLHQSFLITVVLNTSPGVAGEAREIFEAFAPSRNGEPTDSAKLTARFELLFDPAEEAAARNTLLDLSFALEKMTGGVTVDFTNGRFV